MSNFKCEFSDCSESVESEKIQCSGSCSRQFHPKCVGLKKAAVTVLKEYKNIKWNCDDCCNVSLNTISTNMVECTKAVTSLITKISPILDRMSTPSLIQWPKPISHITDNESEMDTDATETRSTKRKRITPQVRLNRLPNIRKPETTFGTSEASSNLKSYTSLKHVYVSHLHPSTKESDIMDYIKDNITVPDITSIKCKRLVAANKDIDDLEFVSFKISASESDYTTIVNPSSWPKNIVVREFEQRTKSGSSYAFLPTTQNRPGPSTQA